MAVVADVALALATAYAYVDGHGGQDGREGLVWWGGGDFGIHSSVCLYCQFVSVCVSHQIIGSLGVFF